MGDLLSTVRDYRPCCTVSSAEDTTHRIRAQELTKRKKEDGHGG